jgi:hypothetical protein
MKLYIEKKLFLDSLVAYRSTYLSELSLFDRRRLKKAKCFQEYITYNNQVSLII